MMGGDDGPKKVIVVRKKAKGHGHGHHGGAWKVAYADFVTAMMAFFLVMWIMGMDSDVKDIVQGYFANPIGFTQGYAAGSSPLMSGSATETLDLRRAILSSRRAQMERFEGTIRRVTGAIEESVKERFGSQLEAAVELVVTEEGLRIELMETSEAGLFFAQASPTPSPLLQELLAIVGPELSMLPNQVVVEGHTDATPFRGRSSYSNWELSTDRAHAARRVLEEYGVPSGRMAAVRGFSDRRLRNEDDPRAPENRRISILLPFVSLGELERVEEWTPGDDD